MLVEDALSNVWPHERRKLLPLGGGELVESTTMHSTDPFELDPEGFAGRG